MLKVAAKKKQEGSFKLARLLAPKSLAVWLRAMSAASRDQTFQRRVVCSESSLDLPRLPQF